MRRWWWPATGLLVAILTAVVLFVVRGNGELTVNGQVVPPDELRTYAAAHSLDLDTPDGHRAAVAGITRFKVVQQQAYDRGLVGYLDYAGFLRDLEKKNKQPGYGVTSYQPASYLSYLESNLSLGLRRALVAERRITPTEAQLQAFYSAHKDEYARRTDTIQLTLQGGGRIQRLRIDDANAYTYSKYRTTLFTAAQELAVGDSVPVIGDTAGGQVLVTCTARTPGGYKTLPEVRQELTERYVDQQFQRYLDALTTATRVEEK
ncbi:peptidylprolyl isomerase [Kribbella sp. NBC_00662]|uniref:peptidylprolyl isomerase n=1 Tax=Kribbella sp. NBC_00662 TaxID=2975969 RepID=UPI00324C4D0F